VWFDSLWLLFSKDNLVLMDLVSTHGDASFLILRQVFYYLFSTSALLVLTLNFTHNITIFCYQMMM
jgi:hypothetical protein